MEQWLHSVLPGVALPILFLIIALSLYLLSKGADILVDEAVTLSVRWGIPKVVIGATIVSLGTTLPEASVSVAAAFRGNPEIALGNAVGSVICDSSLIIGIASLIRPLPIHRSSTDRQSWLQLGSGLLLVLIALPYTNLKEIFSSSGIVPQWAGYLLVFLLMLYLGSSFRRARKGTLDSVDLEGELEELDESSVPLVVLKLAAALILIIGSSKVLLPTVEVTALDLGIPQSIIAATLVAFGTSLPELITAVQASRKGHGELAVGNVIGADILNVLFVIGAAAAVTPQGLAVPSYFYSFHLPIMLGILILFKLFMTTGSPSVSRLQGSSLLAIYILYSVFGYVLI